MAGRLPHVPRASLSYLSRSTAIQATQQRRSLCSCAIAFCFQVYGDLVKQATDLTAINGSAQMPPAAVGGNAFGLDAETILKVLRLRTQVHLRTKRAFAAREGPSPLGLCPSFRAAAAPVGVYRLCVLRALSHSGAHADGPWHACCVSHVDNAHRWAAARVAAETDAGRRFWRRCGFRFWRRCGRRFWRRCGLLSWADFARPCPA